LETILEYLRSTIGTVVIINLVLAAAALLKDVFFASYLGTSAQADALILAFLIPDALANGLIAAAIGVSCVPVFSELYVKENLAGLKRVIKKVTILFFLASLALAVLFFIFRNQIFSVLGSGLDAESIRLCIRLFLILLPTILLFPFTAIETSILQVFDSFKIPAFAPVLYNLVFLGGIVIGHFYKMPVDRGVYLIAYAITAGVFAMALLLWIPLSGTFKRLGPLTPDETDIRHRESTEGVKDILKVFFSYLLLLICIQSVQLVERHLASYFEEGSIAALNYAYRLSQFPIWVFAAAVGVVILPLMSKSRGAGRDKDTKRTLGKSLKLVLLIVIPIASAFYFLREPIVTILLQRGAFDIKSMQATAGILEGYAIAVVGQGILAICLKYFLAERKILYPLLTYAGGTIVNIALDYYFVRTIGLPGLGYGAAAGACINTLLLTVIIIRKLRVNLKNSLAEVFKVLLANVPLSVLFILYGRLWNLLQIDGNLLHQAVYVILVVSTGGVVYWAGLHIFKAGNI